MPAWVVLSAVLLAASLALKIAADRPARARRRNRTVLRTARLVLRPARPGDLLALHAIFTDAEAMAYWSTPPHRDLATTQAWLESMLAADPAESCDFIVERDGRVIGKAGCWRLPEVGYILARDQWGQGLAREALEAVVAHVFAAHPLAALIADVDPRNARSLALLKGLGFVETSRAERTMQVGEAWVDSVYLKLARPA
ncbi:MAG: GNAT family N-acetyltransferase [Proteobacteria bacterium]|nr:GNAT family N-acetyltransferase [Pseudomonadota bacterium]